MAVFVPYRFTLKCPNCGGAISLSSLLDTSSFWISGTIARCEGCGKKVTWNSASIRAFTAWTCAFAASAISFAVLTLGGLNPIYQAANMAIVLLCLLFAAISPRLSEAPG